MGAAGARAVRLAAGLALARVVPAALRPLVARTDGTLHLSVFLLVRELRRDAQAWRVAAVVAVTLLALAVPIEHGAASDRTDRVGLFVGGDRVLSVRTAAGVGLPGVVSELDPTGRWAMAAEEIAPFGGPELRTLAVDAPRLRRSRPGPGVSAASTPPAWPGRGSRSRLPRTG